MNPLLLPPRLLLRALDDLHTLARSASRVEAQLASALELGERIDVQGRAIVERADRMDERAGEVAERGAELAGALPVLQRAVEMAEPLEGAVERLGRMVDRLPGSRR